MRALICLCALFYFGTGLRAGETPQPGREPAFLSRILADSEQGSHPWKTYRQPPESASAVVEVVGELTREELRQVAFQEFQIWFKEDLQQFWRRHGFPDPAANWPSSTLPVNRFGGNPAPQNVPLGKIGF